MLTKSNILLMLINADPLFSASSFSLNCLNFIFNVHIHSVSIKNLILNKMLSSSINNFKIWVSNERKNNLFWTQTALSIFV